MAMYEYKCQFCRKMFTSVARADRVPCPICLRDAKRRFSFAVQPSFQDGYTPTVGGYVSSERDLREQLKRKSDEATERNGIPHSYVPIDLRDMDACGVTPEGIAENQEMRIKEQERKAKPPPDIKLEVRHK